MAAVTTSTLSGQYQTYFSKELLKYAVQALVLGQFGQKAPLPTKAGTKTISWFRFNAPQSGYDTDGVTLASASGTGIASLTEGTPMSTSKYRTLSLTKVDGTLTQYGQVIQLTDVLTSSELFNSLEQAVRLNGEDAAYFCDATIRNTLAAGTTKRYSGGATSFSGLYGLSKSAGSLSSTDALDAVTNLKINRAPLINGSYAAAVPVQCARDLMRDATWLAVKEYSDKQDLYNGELGKMYGCRFVSHTNPWVEDEAEGTYDAVLSGGSNTNSLVYSTLFFGDQAFGIPDLGGSAASGSPMAPQVIITDKADKSDPLNQTINVGFKTFWGTKILNDNYFVVHRSLSQYA